MHASTAKFSTFQVMALPNSFKAPVFEGDVAGVQIQGVIAGVSRNEQILWTETCFFLRDHLMHCRQMMGRRWAAITKIDVAWTWHHSKMTFLITADGSCPTVGISNQSTIKAKSLWDGRVHWQDLKPSVRDLCAASYAEVRLPNGSWCWQGKGSFQGVSDALIQWSVAIHMYTLYDICIMCIQYASIYRGISLILFVNILKISQVQDVSCGIFESILPHGQKKRLGEAVA